MLQRPARAVEHGAVGEGAELVVVGGGIVGAAAAYHGAEAGARTVLLDDAADGQATAAGAGILSPDTSPEPDERWYGFAADAAAHYRHLVPQLADECGLDCGYGPCEVLCVARHESERPWWEERAALARARTGGAAAEVGAAEACERVPVLRPPAAAFLSPRGARLDGRLMLAALREAAARRGVRRVAGRAASLCTRGSRVVAVETAEGLLGCDAVVVAAGAWTAPLLEPLSGAVPVAPMKGQIVHLALPEGDAAGTGAWPIVQPVATHYLVPWPEGRVVCGGTMEAAAGFDTAVTAAGVHELLREALHLAPGLAGAALVQVRVGLRPTTPDGRPILGRVPGWENAWVAAGHGTEGLLLGPYSASVVARAALGRRDAEGRLAPEIFSPARFGG